MEENGTFRTRGKAYHKPFLFARFVGFGFQKRICFRGADDRLADDEMRLFDSFCCGDCSFRRVSLGRHRSGTGFSYSGSDLEALPRGHRLFPRLPAGLGETISLCVFRVRDATNKRMNPALSVWLAIPGDPAWDNAEALILFYGRNRKRLHFRGIAKGQSSGKSRCGLIGWLFAANANGVQCLDFSHPFSRAVTARAGPRHDSLFIPRDNLFNRDFTASVAETA